MSSPLIKSILNHKQQISNDSDIAMDEEVDLDALKTYSTPDILICGNCR